MKNITRTFIISNIVSAVVLVSTIPLLVGQKTDILNNKQDIWKGILLLLTFLLGFVLRIMKSIEVAKNGKRSLSIIEKLFLGVLFMFALSSSLNFASISSIYIFGSHDSDGGMTYTIILILSSIFILLFEAFMVFADVAHVPTKPKKSINFLYGYYMSAGIALSWDVSIIGGDSGLSLGMENLWSELGAYVLLALMMILSIQRLFWFEVFINSNGWRDNLKVVSSIVLVLICAIVPLFFI